MWQTRHLIAALLGAALSFTAPTMATDLHNGSACRVTLRQGPIVATVTTAATPAQRPLPTPVIGASNVEFRLWAQSSVGPLNLIVFSHSEDAR